MLRDQGVCEGKTCYLTYMLDPFPPNELFESNIFGSLKAKTRRSEKAIVKRKRAETANE